MLWVRVDDGQQLAPVVPRGVVGEVAADLGAGELKLLLGRDL